MKKLISVISGLLLLSSMMFAQNTISGTVFDTESIPVPGVTVMIKGTTNGTITGADGKYSIKAKEGDVLLFTCLGMIDHEVVVGNSTDLSVKLATDRFNLDDAVVIGYGTVKKSDLTGAVASVKTDELKNSKIGMVTNALQGTAAGVRVTQYNMKPGAGASIIVRGVSSVNADAAPLCIVDGVPADLNNVATSDIESIEILKDASAAAIYGSRGSNGVVLITTKKGLEGKSKVTFNAMAGLQAMLNKQDMMNAQQYYDIINESGIDYIWTAEELRLLSRGESTDWQDAVSQTGKFQNYSLSVSNGTKNSTNYLGVDYYDHEGILRNSGFDRLTLRFNNETKINDWFKVGGRFSMISSKINNINEDTTGYGSGYGTMYCAMGSQPTAPIYAYDGEYFDGFLNTQANPRAMVDLLDRSTKNHTSTGSLFAEIEPVKNLFIKTDNTIVLTSSRTNEYEDGRMGQHYAKEGTAAVSASLYKYMQSENTITYVLDKDKHKATFMGGFSVSKDESESAATKNKGVNSVTKYYNIYGSEDHGPNSSGYGASTLASFFARATYSFNDRYLFTATMRADGSSRFADNHKWGYFPSVAFAWKASEEDFLKNTEVNNLKVRVSFGQLGNQNIGNYQAYATVSEGGFMQDYSFGGTKFIGANYATIANTELTWEKATQADLGIDFGFFDNRISGTLEGYYKRTKDLLWTVDLPKESGYITSLTNIGKLDNKGIEFTINTVNVNSHYFQWTTGFNISYNRNEVVELYDGKTDFNKSVFVGHSLGEYYMLKSVGIWQLNEATEAANYGAQPGDRKILDCGENGEADGVINGDDRQFLGQSTPTFYGGMTNTFTFGDEKLGNFDLTVFFNFAGGYYAYNNLLCYQNAFNKWGNMSTDYYYNHWTIDNPSNKYPAARLGASYANGDGTSAVLQKGDYLRLKNVELGYSLPYRLLENSKLSSVRFYVSAQNLATLTAFTGYDIEAGDKINTYPGARAFIGGVTINF